jgi:hypothetical protein
MSESVISLFCLGTRVLLAKYAGKVLGSFKLAQIAFIADCAIGIIILVISASLEGRHFINLGNGNVWMWNGVASFFCIMGDVNYMMALETGVTGPTVAIASFNSIVVSLLSLFINGVLLSSL